MMFFVEWPCHAAGFREEQEVGFMNDTAKILIVLGAMLIVAGCVLLVAGKIPGLGKLPGDFLIKKDNFTFYFPLATCLLMSAIVSLILFLWNQE